MAIVVIESKEQAISILSITCAGIGIALMITGFILTGVMGISYPSIAGGFLAMGIVGLCLTALGIFIVYWMKKNGTFGIFEPPK